MPKLIDVHTHVQFAAYESDYKDVIQRAINKDIWMVNVGTQRDTSKSAVELANEYQEGVYAAIGLHPIHTTKSHHDLKELGGGETAKEFVSRGEEFDPEYYLELGKDKKVVAIGECGLDYYRLEEKTKDRQKEAFLAQIEVSKKLNKPLMIHCRDAFSDLIDLLTAHRQSLLFIPGVVHFFTGSVYDAKKLMDLGFYFSFGGVTTFARDYDDQIKTIGINRIVLETDAPYVSPSPFRGKRNESSYIDNVASAIAGVLNISHDEVAEKTTDNARRVFKI